MSVMARLLHQLGVLARAVPYALPGVGPARARRHWPRTDGELVVSGPLAPVEIHRDEWGVPHLYAANEADLLFAQGFVQAQDRLWHLLLGRAVGRGALAAILGPPGVPVDRLMRTLGLRETAERWWRELPGEPRGLLEAFVAGVNAGLAGAPLPVECEILRVPAEPWTPVDSLLRGALFAHALGGNHRLELLRARLVAEAGEEVADLLLPRSAPEAPEIVPREARLDGLRGAAPLEGLDGVDALLGDPNIVSGSNNWVVHGRRTASGKPLLASDVHIGLALPGVFYESGLHGGRFDVVGFSLPGVPFIVLGHNGRVGWGMSNLGPDTQDFYVEELDDATAPQRYRYRGEWRPLEIRRETIEVRGAAPVAIEVRTTAHGPIMNQAMSVALAGAPPMALRSTLPESGSLLPPLLAMNLAADCAAFRAALAGWEIPGQNFVFADTLGHIGYQATGRIPLRRPGHLGYAPVDGAAGDSEWRGFIPFAELPASADPPAGFIATANNRITDDSYPHLIAWNWFPGYRARRIVDLLAASDRHTVEDMARIQAETQSLPAAALRPRLACVQPATALEQQALAALMAWDLRFEIDRVGATVYQAFYIHLLRRLLAHRLGPAPVERYLASDYERHGSLHVPTVIAAADDPSHPLWTDTRAPGGPVRRDRDEVIGAAFRAAVAWLAKTWGRDPRRWQWGRVHRLALSHQPLGALPVIGGAFGTPAQPAPGDNYTVDGASFVWSAPFTVVHGTALRMVLDFADLSRSIGVHLPGQSGHPHHPHRDDLLALARGRRYHPLLHGRSAVEAHLRHRLTLRPAPGK